MTKLLRYCYWRTVYLFRRRPADLDEFLDKVTRTRWPWWEFRPSVLRNEVGRMWQVYLAEERGYTEPGVTLTVNAHVSRETGRIVGFDVHDEDLEAVAQRRPGG